ncbi:MAG: hypothetical protein JWO52_2263, partial [Gammaproteobacteria bacterium]|nr:hypothetical protein [Gammaproteobacteria bacterium]
MSFVLYPPARPQSIGEVIDTAFRIFKATLLRSLPYSVLATVAGQLQNIYLIVSGRTLHRFANTDPAWWLLYLLGAFTGAIFINAILIRQAATASGSASMGSAALVEGLRKTPAAIVMGLLVVLFVGVCFAPMLAIPRSYYFLSFLALCIPALYVGVFFLCSWPALLMGRKSIIGSLRYSANLIRGNWWRTVMIYTVAVTMIIVLSVTAGMIVGVLAAFGAARDLAVTTAVSAVMVVASGAVYMPFITAMTLS